MSKKRKKVRQGQTVYVVNYSPEQVHMLVMCGETPGQMLVNAVFIASKRWSRYFFEGSAAFKVSNTVAASKLVTFGRVAGGVFHSKRKALSFAKLHAENWTPNK